MGGNYIEFNINRDEIARYGLALGDVQEVLEVALGGMPLTTTVEGLERYSINLRYDRDFRENLEALKQIIVPTPSGAQIPLGQIATLNLVRAPMGVKSEGAIPNAWIYIDVKGIDVGTYVQMAQRAVSEAVAKKQVVLPSGYNVFWSGQYEYMQRAKQRLAIVIPITLLLIILIIYLNTRSLVKTAIVLLAVPFSLVGAFWLIYLAGYNLSVAVWIGIIALAGLDAETGVVMLLYLDLAYSESVAKHRMRSDTDLRDAIYHGAVKRVRPKAMTAAVIIGGLLPIIWSHGAGADVMKRIATPMIGGVVTSTLMELIVYPAIFFVWRSRRFTEQPVLFAAEPVPAK
jgi:Cu(I)/Ag(I) efflux system membrane protein CusA/SilA